MEEKLTLSRSIKSVRNKLNLTQTRFGSKIGVSGKTVSAYETGRSTPPLRVLEAISRVYDINFVQLKQARKNDLGNKIQYIRNSLIEIENILKDGLSL